MLLMWIYPFSSLPTRTFERLSRLPTKAWRTIVWWAVYVPRNRRILATEGAESLSHGGDGQATGAEVFNRGDIDMAATLLVLAAALALKPVIDTLINIVMQSVTIQVQEGLRPSLTTEKIVVLHRLHHDVTDHLVQRIARLSGS
jgi:hypothetical protein